MKIEKFVDINKVKSIKDSNTKSIKDRINCPLANLFFYQLLQISFDELLLI